jgi:5-(carboxyamino)imidazole ribonucleotide mutase
MPGVLILLGSASDKEVCDRAVAVLRELGVAVKATVASTHRTPDRVVELVRGSDADVFIGIAGVAAALPGSIAALTTKPVIGVPVSGKVNLDSILSIVQMPPGIPVATVGLDRGDNAAILAAQMIALKDPALAKRLEQYRAKQREKVHADAKTFEAGYEGGR